MKTIILRLLHQSWRDYGHGLTVGKLSSVLGRSAPTIVEHLREMRARGLITAHQANGRMVPSSFRPADFDPSATSFRVIDVFAGAGGLSLGFRRAGFRMEVAVERDRDCCRTYRGLHPDVELIESDSARVGYARLSGMDVLVGGPNCQPFTSNPTSLGRHDDRDMIPEFVRALSGSAPRAFVMENVPGLVSRMHRPYFDEKLSTMTDLGYQVQWRILDAADFGVPQHRRRVFVVGTRDASFIWPEPTHGPGRLFPHAPASLARRPGDLGGSTEKVSFAIRPRLKRSPYGGRLFNKGSVPIRPDSPAPTILATGIRHFWDTAGAAAGYHAALRRGEPVRTGQLEGAIRLTVREAALIQGFPEDTVFHGNLMARYRQVGNAVPAPLAEALAWNLMEAFVRATSPAVREAAEAGAIQALGAC